MRKKKYAGKLMIGMIIGMLACNAFSIQAAASVPEGMAEMEAVNPTISDGVHSSNLVWMTKTENGRKYKRLYDLETDKWLTDWIPC